MTLQVVQGILAQRPFPSLRVGLDDGRSYEIHRRKAAFLTQTELVVGIDVSCDGIPAEFKILSLSHVTAIEPLIGNAA
ncbi:MAG: hypothetical protein QM811_22765 [Pirellulales bacterium]